jgi:hypothetical protein
MPGRMSKEEKDKRLATKAKSQLLIQYLNEMEKIVNSYDADELKTSKITQLSMLVGKVTTMFSDIAERAGLFDIEA